MEMAVHVDLEGLRILDAVIEHGSFAKAAAKLNCTQPAISYKLKKLEERLNVAIFDREHYRAELTPAGLVILEEARRLLHHAERLRTIAQSFETGWEAYLEVVIDGAMPMDPVMRTLKLMADRDVPTRVQMKIEFLDGVQACFEADEADIMIARDYRESPFHVIEPLRDIEFVLCVSSDHPLAGKERVNLLELEDHVKLTINGSRSRMDLSGKTGVDGRRVFYLSDFDSKKRAILLGLGYGWMPVYLVHEELRSGRVKVVPYENGSWYGFTPKFVTRSNKPFGKAGQFFKATLLEQIAQDWLGTAPSLRGDLAANITVTGQATLSGR